MTEKEFHDLVFCYRDLMYRFASNLLNDDAEAQDSVQVLMLKMWQQKERLGAVEDMKSYILRAVKNECLNIIQRKQTNGKHLALVGANQPTTNDTMPGNTAQLIRSFVSTLPRKQQQVILLKDIEELETSEIAALLDIDETAVRTNLARARQKVREYLQKIEIYEQQRFQ